MNTHLAGHTPLIRINFRIRGEARHIYAKLEYFNPSGSIKDRIASYMLQRATERGELKPGQPIVETTSGNTGIAFAALGAMTNHPVHIFMPERASEERRKLMLLYGAKLHLVSDSEGGFFEAIKRARALTNQINAYCPLQFDNSDNSAAHRLGTAAEILEQVPGVTDFISGIGTGGTLMGTGGRLKEERGASIIALQPDNMRLLTDGVISGTHRIEGIGDDFVPSIVDMNLIDRVYDISDVDAIAMSALLARRIGLGVGISSGANFLISAIRASEDSSREVVTVFADDNKKYLTTDLAGKTAFTSQTAALGIELECVD